MNKEIVPANDARSGKDGNSCEEEDDDMIQLEPIANETGSKSDIDCDAEDSTTEIYKPLLVLSLDSTTLSSSKSAKGTSNELLNQTENTIPESKDHENGNKKLSNKTGTTTTTSKKDKNGEGKLPSDAQNTIPIKSVKSEPKSADPSPSKSSNVVPPPSASGNPGQPNNNGMSKTRLGLIVGGGALAAIGTVAAAPLVLGAVGFGAGGVLGGSFAAFWQASIGNVVAGSFFASLQSAGVLGFAASTTAAVGVVGGAGGALVTKGVMNLVDSAGGTGDNGSASSPNVNPAGSEDAKKGKENNSCGKDEDDDTKPEPETKKMEDAKKCNENSNEEEEEQQEEKNGDDENLQDEPIHNKPGRLFVKYFLIVECTAPVQAAFRIRQLIAFSCFSTLH